MIGCKHMDKDTIRFLIRAKKATYAGKGAEAESSRPNSHDLRYIEGPLNYIDSYLGGGKFAREEAVLRRAKCIQPRTGCLKADIEV